MMWGSKEKEVLELEVGFQWRGLKQFNVERYKGGNTQFRQTDRVLG